MKYHNYFRLRYIITVSCFLTAALLSISAGKWLSKPNNFVFTKESRGAWNTSESSNFRASGFNVKINAECAKKTYHEIEESAATNIDQADSENETSSSDFKRFLQNKKADIEFQTAEINYTSRFKWHKNNYITYDDPSLKSGVRFSFSNKCLYDKECSLSDSLDYLLVKIGIKYFINADQFNYLKTHCIENQKVFFKIKNKYNFGRSEMYYRNGMGIWLGIWYNLLGTVILLISIGVLAYLILRKKTE